MKPITELIMYKEIHETPQVLSNFLNRHVAGSKFNFDERLIERLKNADQIEAAEKHMVFKRPFKARKKNWSSEANFFLNSR